MCTLIVLRRPGHPWPLLLAGNRDEMRDRRWKPPARHWDDRPGVVAGLDLLGGGSWMGINDQGVSAAVMNRTGTLGPAAGKRSRGELVLEVLDHAEAGAAARALAELDPGAYRPFNLFIGDPREGFWLRHAGAGIEVLEVPPGVHMLTARELDDSRDPRIRRYLPRFREARIPDPESGVWDGWVALLASRIAVPGEEPRAAISFELESGFGTISSSLIAIPAHPGFGPESRWLFAPGPPDREGFVPVCQRPLHSPRFSR